MEQFLENDDIETNEYLKLLNSIQQEQDEDESIKLLKKAERSDIEAMTLAAIGYYSGQYGLPKHDTLAFYWSKRVVDEYPEEAETGWELVGRCYQFGVGTEASVPLAIDAYRKSAEMGNPDAMYCLAEMYYFDAEEHERSKCVFWLEKACALGNVRSTTMLGDLYVNGEFVKKNLEKGMQLLEKANEVGDPQAARLLAERYLDGDGVPENIPRANYYWTTAVKNGEKSQKAIYYAGLAWFYGVGVERDFKWARKCFEELIFDDTNAILGAMLFEGVGGPVDRKEGEKRLRKAIESSDPKISLDAMNNLGMYFYRASERLYEAIQLFTDAAEHGNTQAQVNLGKAYYEGKGVLKNEEKAVYYFRMAAAQGNEIAISNLKAIGHSVTATKYKAQHDEERTTKREEPTNRKKRHPVRGAIIGYFAGWMIGVVLNRVLPGNDWLTTFFALMGILVGLLKG